MKLLDTQNYPPSSLVPLRSKHREHTLVKNLQQIKMISSKTLTNHRSKLQYTVIYNTTFRELGQQTGVPNVSQRYCLLTKLGNSRIMEPLAIRYDDRFRNVTFKKLKVPLIRVTKD
jgi:hypothetical protein